jgi:hypothetical protein
MYTQSFSSEKYFKCLGYSAIELLICQETNDAKDIGS